MKWLWWPGSIICLLLLGSCNKAVTGITSSGRLKAVAALTSQSQRQPVRAVKDTISTTCLLSNDTSKRPFQVPNAIGSHTVSRASIFQQYTFSRAKDKIVEALNKESTLPVLMPSATAYERPHINKVGLILIGAAIVAYFLHLILVAVIVLFVLGVIILVAPFFKKRKY